VTRKPAMGIRIVVGVENAGKLGDERELALQAFVGAIGCERKGASFD
jgi:hypothetical protein